MSTVLFLGKLYSSKKLF